ncbi:SAM-dependent methyltransferase [Paenibacillus pini]|uniref:LSU rRNA 2'-O-methyl-C2498 methyltransferase RlmM n=2 Tax=Paenibacillus TaxID=44249 RepID=W7YYL1_9BACL|nr:LSU rRNA 2'-O-methyl-C2498 methyltransferase RlmM [Paenibacillus pini JCM 16418]
MNDVEVMNENEEIIGESKFVCTANHGFAPYAQEELRRRFGSLKSRVLMSGEVFLLTLQVEPERALEMIVNHPPIFLRHIQPVDWEVNIDNIEEGFKELSSILLKEQNLQGAQVSLQVRKSDDSLWEESAGSLREVIQSHLTELQADFVLQDAEWCISIFAAGNILYAGISKPQNNLSDWSGGAVRFQREDGQISRAKFKLLEAERSFGIDFQSFRKALDIGAAPGGWTSFLLERGLQVTAVDPALMHESLVSNPALKILRKNASEVKFRDHEFDLLVCDMSWSPKQMVRLVTELLPALRTGGTAIITVKLMHKKPMALINDVISSFEHVDMQVQSAKQLFHNRDEITLYMIKY